MRSGKLRSSCPANGEPGGLHVHPVTAGRTHSGCESRPLGATAARTHSCSAIRGASRLNTHTARTQITA